MKALETLREKLEILLGLNDDNINVVNQQEQEMYISMTKYLELERENRYLRILINKLLEDSVYTIEDLLGNMEGLNNESIKNKERHG